MKLFRRLSRLFSPLERVQMMAAPAAPAVPDTAPADPQTNRASYTDADLTRLTSEEVAALLHAIRRAGHRVGSMLPLEELFASVPPEKLDHLVYAQARTGALRALAPSQVDTILHALREAHPELVPPRRKQRHLSIDIVGTCNLRCPSCPVGNVSTNPSGLMSFDLFARILEKARRDYAVEIVYLFNWTEPFLHPELPAFVSHVRAQGLPCGLSSNLNNVKNLAAVIAARPNAIRISLSGFTQEVYGQTHKGGDVERVKQNMALLRAEIDRQGATEIGVHVYYHKYRHNQHEVAPMREYAERLNFGWQENWAFLQPVEKALDLMEHKLPPEQELFATRQYAIPLREAVAAARQYRHEPCTIIKDLTIDVQGYMTLCCATYDTNRNRTGYFLDMTPDDVSRSKTGHELCEKCTSHGLHLHYRYDHHPALQTVHNTLAAKQALESEGSKGRIPLPLL